MSVYADTEVKDRTLVQKLQDQLYEALKGDGENIGYGLVAATPANMMLVVKLDRVSHQPPQISNSKQGSILTSLTCKNQQRYNPENPCAETITTIETTYNTIGYILDNDVFITSFEDQVKRFCLSRAPWVIYKMLDKTIATEYARYQQEQKEEKVRQHKREKRKAKKIAAASAEKGTEQERQGVLEANGKDTRKGGKSYKKPQDGETTTNGQTGAGNETQRLEKKIKIGLHNLTINEAKHRILQQTSSIENDKLEVKGKRESRIAEIKKPGWFFSGEDVLKDG